MIGGTKEFNKYLTQGSGVSRKNLNIMCFTAIFVLGFLYSYIFTLLGKRWLSILYPTIVAGSSGVIGFTGVEPEVSIILTITLFIAYFAGWIHANIVLSRLNRQAHHRLNELAKQKSKTIDTLLEEGLILRLALSEKEESVKALYKAIKMVGGDMHLLNHAGVTMFCYGRFEVAMEFYDRAIQSSTDKKFLKVVEINRRCAEKKIP